jgi:DDE superfamily endonuclease
MLLNKPLPFIEDFINELNKGLKSYKPDGGLSKIQCGWIGFCLMGIILTNSVCWARFERVSLGKYRLGALSWMFRKSKLPWEMMLQASIAIVLKQYGISEGTLVTDDSDHERSKKTPRLFKSHKIKDKGSGGYINGQNIVLLILVTDKVSLPVGFEVYQPDPQQQAWTKEDKRLTKKGVAKKKRPQAPPYNPEYPTKPELALRLIGQFRGYHSQIKIKTIVADALYGLAKFMDAASDLFGGVQVISQLRHNQNIRFRGRKQSLTNYFSSYPGVPQKLSIRGQPPITAIVGSIRVEVCAHGKKRFVIALKYPDEQDYRYLVATDMTWRTIDIIQAYTLRWLVEVFIEDWKSYEGWAQLAKQTGKEGTSRGLTLSLLLDLCLLLHPRQIARIESKLPAYTVGSLLRNIQMEALLLYFEQLLQAPNPAEQLNQLSQSVQEFFLLRSSGKHMSGRELGRLEPTPSLNRRAVA